MSQSGNDIAARIKQPTDGLEALREQLEHRARGLVEKTAGNRPTGTAGYREGRISDFVQWAMRDIDKYYQPLIEAASRIAQFGVLAEAIAGDERPFKDGDVLLAIMGSGASDALRWEDMRKLIEALR